MQLHRNFMKLYSKYNRNYFIFYKHFCTFITHINEEDDYIFDSFQSSFTRRIMKYPYNEIYRLRDIKQLKKWEKKNCNEMLEKNNNDELISVYTTLIAKCIDIKAFEYGWKLFELTKKLHLESIFIYSTMLQLIHKQYINRDDGTLDRNAVKLAKNLKNEMKNVYNINPSATFYGLLLKIYVQLNEYELAEKTWNEYLNNRHNEMFRTEIFNDNEKNPISDIGDEHKLTLENSILWNYMLSLYRRQNKMDKVFEIYDIILKCNVILINSPTFVQILVAISQIISSQMEKSHNIPKQKSICNKYVIYAENVFIDAHKYCSYRIYDNRFGSYVIIYNSLMECYSNLGQFYLKCRNFWKLMYKKDIKYLFETFDETNHDQINQIEHLYKLKDCIPNIDQYTIRQMILCLQNCCQSNNKYDNINEYDIYIIFDEILNVIENDKKYDKNIRFETRIESGWNMIFFDIIHLIQAIMDNFGNNNNDYCYKYLFKFYNYYETINVKPMRRELSSMLITVNKFFKYHKIYKPNNMDDLEIVHGCLNKSQFDTFIDSQCIKYKINKNTLSFDPKGGHKRMI